MEEGYRHSNGSSSDSKIFTPFYRRISRLYPEVLNRHLAEELKEYGKKAKYFTLNSRMGFQILLFLFTFLIRYFLEIGVGGVSEMLGISGIATCR